MALTTALLYFAYFLITLWCISFVYNVYFFASTESNEADLACFNRSRTFEEALEDLTNLERIKQTTFNSARQKIMFYKKNARLTRRQYPYYADRIEEGFIRLYLGHSQTKAQVFKNLDKPVRFHFGFLLFFCALILLFFLTIFVFHIWTNFGLISFFVGSTLIAIYVRFFINIIQINAALFYGLINLFLYLLKVNRSKLFMNTGILHFLTKNWSGFNEENLVIGIGAVGSFSAPSTGGFGGYGGGSFGGGGAGGSW